MREVQPPDTFVTGGFFARHSGYNITSAEERGFHDSLNDTALLMSSMFIGKELLRKFENADKLVHKCYLPVNGCGNPGFSVVGGSVGSFVRSSELTLDIHEDDQYNRNKLITFAIHVGRMLPLGESSGVCFFRRCVG